MSDNKTLVLDFWTNVYWEKVKDYLHFRVYGDKPTFILTPCFMPLITFDDGVVYKIVDGKEIPFTPRIKDKLGNRFTAQDIVQDCLERIARNETDGFEVERACDVIQAYTNAFMESVANDSLVRPIPYYIIFDNRLLKLQYATNRFLFYDDTMEMPVMFRTVDGSLVSNNEFAEIGLLQTMDAVQEKEEKQLEIRQYPDLTKEEFAKKYFPDAVLVDGMQANWTAPEDEDDMDFPW